MSYFQNFPFVNYRFGTQADPTIYQNLGVYVDLVDVAKDDAAFYTYYDLQDGDRADQISQKLYNRPDLHWTFSILNDNVKIQGWPLAYRDLLAKVKKDYPNVTINTRTDITETFKDGSIITGSTSGSQAVILRRRLDLGQLVVGRIAEDKQFTLTTDVKGYAKLELTTPGERFVESDKWSITSGGVRITTPTVVSGGAAFAFVEFNFGETNANSEYIFNLRVMNYGINPSFADGEVITTTEDGVVRSAIIDTSSLEYLATHHYENASGEYVDITPNAPFVQRVTLELEAEGSSASEIAGAKVKTINISALGHYSTNTTLTDIQKNIDSGNYQSTGSLFKAVVAGYNEVRTVGATLTLDELTGVGGTSDNYFANNFPDTADLTELNSELNTELAAAITAADTNASGKYDITVHMFFLIDNQLNIILDDDIFGVSYEYKIATVTQYVNKYTTGSTTETTSPAPTSRSSAWDDLAVQLETYIQQNLSTFNPAILTQVTYLDRYIASNNALRRIKVLRPEVAEEIVETFNQVLLESGQQESTATVASGPQGAGVSSVTGSTQPTTTVSGQTITSSSAGAVAGSSSSGSSSGGGYY